MDRLDNLLDKYARQEPPEIVAIKQYVADNLHVTPSVAFQGEAIIITVKSAALAGTLRMHTTKLRAAAHTDKQLIFRIA